MTMVEPWLASCRKSIIIKRFGAGIQSSRGLIQEKHAGFGQKLDSQAHALALPAAQRRHGIVPALLVNFQRLQHLFHATIDFVIGSIVGQAQLRRVVETVAHRQLPVHDVFLRDKSDGRFHRVEVLIQIHAVIEHLARGRFHEPVQRVHQRGLARAAGPQQADQFLGLDHQGKIIEQQFGLAGIVVRRPGNSGARNPAAPPGRSGTWVRVPPWKCSSEGPITTRSKS